MKSNQIKLVVKSISSLEEFINKMVKVNRGLCLKISSSEILCATYKSGKEVVKMSSVLLGDIFELDSVAKFPTDVELYLSVTDATQLIKALNIFPSGEKIEIIFNYELSAKHNTNHVDKIYLSSSSLKLTLNTTMIELVFTLDSNQMQKAFSINDTISFSVTKDTISKILSLSDYDSESSIISVESDEEDAIYFKGSNYEYKIADTVETEYDIDTKIDNFFFTKEQLKTLDKENYVVRVNTKKGIHFISTDGYTKIVIAKQDTN